MPVQDPRDLNPTFSALFNAGDVRGLVRLYAPDAVFHASSGPVTGREAIHAEYTDMIAGSPGLELRTRRILSSGDTALITTDDATSTGVSVEVARRQPDGTWLYVIDEPRLSR
ncbi:MAG: nuclear transport factor 2 family protein [Catenulispora sp.]|nr:nuclear transport factor 2 family protein [Catenulispora sp.]